MLINKIVRKMKLFWRRKKIPSTATATTCCHHYHEEQTQTDFYLQNSVPKLFFTSWKPKVIFKHIWKLPLSIPIHNVNLLQQPYGIFYNEISSTMNPYNLSLSADLHTTHGSTKPRNLPTETHDHATTITTATPHLHHHEPTKKFIPQSNQTHIKIRIQGNKQSIKLRKRNKIYFERFRISEAFLSSISSSINSVASLALITATKAQIATTASARSGLGFGHCWTRWWPTMAYATQSQRDVGDGETDAKRERDMGDGCINFYNYKSL